MKSVSISRAKCFNNCALQYKYNYYEKFEPAEQQLIAVRDKGLVLHETFENLLKYENYEKDEAKLPMRKAENNLVMAYFKQAMDANKFPIEEAINFNLKRGLKRWLSFKHDYLDKNGHVMYAEKRYDQTLFGETRTITILDLLEDCGNGNYIIYDYKTPQKVNMNLYKEQLTLYAYVMAIVKGIITEGSDEYDKVAEHFKLFVFFPLLDKDGDTYEDCLHELKFKAEDVKNTIEHLKETCGKIDAFDFSKPAEALQPAKANFQCNWCAFKGAAPDPTIKGKHGGIFEGCPLTHFIEPSEVKFKPVL